jgi:putative DNA primase/helicase
MSDFDTHKQLLNLNNGTFDLLNMQLRPHRREDFITRLALADYAGGAVCERWERFVDEITGGEKETARFLQKSLGYALSGSTEYECAFLLWGATSRNGKSTLAETVSHILGDYAKTAAPQTFSNRPPDGAKATPDTARLKGARFVVVPEPDRRDAGLKGQPLKNRGTAIRLSGATSAKAPSDCIVKDYFGNRGK